MNEQIVDEPGAAGAIKAEVEASEVRVINIVDARFAKLEELLMRQHDTTPPS